MPLMWSDPAECQVFIDAGEDIEAKDDSGCSPLLWSCSSGSLDVAKLLVRAGAGVCVADNDGDTCLMIAGSNGHTETVRYLLCLPEVEMDGANNCGRTALHGAVKWEHADVVQVLIDAGADIEARTNSGWPALFIASASGELVIVKKLVDAGAVVCTANSKGNTALIHASYAGRTDVVRYLASLKGTAVNHTNNDGKTALHLATALKHADVVKVLLEHGADKSLQNRDGDTALRLAEISGCPDCCRYLC